MMPNDPDFEAFVDSARNELIPKMTQAGAIISLVPQRETDIKYALELGLSIMMNKPIIAVVQTGVEVPEKLRRVADHVIEADLTDMELLMPRLTEALKDLGLD